MPTASKRAPAQAPPAPARHSTKKQEMLRFLEALTPAERASLADPNYVTEDEADWIVCERRLRRGGRLISLQQLLKRYGRKPRRLDR